MSFVPYLKQSNPQKTEKSFESYLNLPSPPPPPPPSSTHPLFHRQWTVGGFA